MTESQTALLRFTRWCTAFVVFLCVRRIIFDNFYKLTHAGICNTMKLISEK